DERPPIAALRREAPVAEDVGHQRREHVGDLDDAEAWLVRPERERVAGQRGRHDGERIGRIAAEPRGVGEHRDDALELHDRPGPSVREEERQRVGPDAWLVDEVNVDAGDRRRELTEAIQGRFVGPPIVLVAPVRNELFHVREVGAVAPRLTRRFVRPAHALEPRAHVGQHAVGHVDRERPRRRHRATFSQCWATSRPLANHTPSWPLMKRMSLRSINNRDGCPIVCGWHVRLKSPPHSYNPRNSSRQIPYTISGLFMGRLRNVGWNMKNGASSSVHCTGSSTIDVPGWMYGNTLSIMFDE